MLDNVQRVIERHRLLRPGQSIVVAVSGGADSTALLLALNELRARRKFSLIVAHLHHGIRGRAADGDAAFVRALAERLGLRFVMARRDVPNLARRKKISVEMAAREARHAFFRSVVARTESHAVAAAHTADDQVETILLRMFRGAGPDGAGGMDYSTELCPLKIIRPMLDVTHADAIAFLRARKQAWREDRSNASPKHLRNRIRHEVLPLLERRVNPAVRAALLRWAEIARGDAGVVENVARTGLRKVSRGGTLRIERMTRLAPGVQRRVIRAWLLGQGMDPERVDFDAIERARALMNSVEGSRWTPVSDAWAVERNYRSLRLVAARTSKPFRTRLNVPGETVLCDGSVVAVAEWSQGIHKPARANPGDLPASVTVSRRAIGRSSVFARSWQRGDRIRPLGMKGSKKLQDIFIDAKVPKSARGRIPILECRGEVIWIPGYRVARGWEVERADAECLRIILKPA